MSWTRIMEIPREDIIRKIDLYEKERIKRSDENGRNEQNQKRITEFIS